MDIFLEFRIQDITPDGILIGLSEEHKVNSVRWKTKPLVSSKIQELENIQYNLYIEGIYTDPDPDIKLVTLAVRAEYQSDPSYTVNKQIGGFVPRDGIENIPLHITINMEQVVEDGYKMGIDNIGPMEGGIRMQESINNNTGDYIPYQDGPLIATANLEYNIIYTWYKFIENECNGEG